MKKKITKLMGIGLAFILVLSLMVAFVPVAAAADYKENDWKSWGLPSLKVDTDVGPMAIAPDGTIYAAVWDDRGAHQHWDLKDSEDDGYTWNDTELTEMDTPIVSVVVSPNYADDETVYVGEVDGTVWRVEEAGEGDVIALKDIVDSEGETASELYCMDVWTDEEDYNWLLVATNLDVLVLRDKTFEDWRDQELAAGIGNWWVAYEVAFAPDFDDSDIIWAVIDDTMYGPAGYDFMVTATASPGKWGQDIGEVDLGVDATPFVDIGFPDDYESDTDSGLTNLWVAVTEDNFSDNGDIFLIEGVDADDGNSNAIAMFTDIGGKASKDFTSIAVSGDYGDEIILAGELWSPEIWISDDGGYSWDDVDKCPTGEGWTHVYMGADVVWGGEVFDPDEGVAFASTVGDESAVSRSNDGGEVYNQTGLIDTEIEMILDLGFHPDFPGTPTYLMSTFDTDNETSSLWLTENGDEEEPDYVRVLCGDPAENVGNLTGWFGLVDYSWDGDAIYIAGTDEDSYSPSESVIWKSTNDGQTFGKKRSVKNDAFIRDWEIPDDRTIYAVTWDFGDNGGTDNRGFYMTTNSGLSWTSAGPDVDMNDIALSPDFEDDETILIGGFDGDVYMSNNAGDTLKNAEDEDESGLTGDVFVAFDADYADEDADGYMLIYACGDDDEVQVGEVTDPDDVDWTVLNENNDKSTADTRVVDCQGLVVAEDNALYAIDEDDAGLDRLLLHESNSVWEASDADVTDPFHLWITPGSNSNVLWTIDDCGAHYGSPSPYTPGLWVLEDTLSGQVTLDSPADGYQSDRLEIIGIAWDEMRGADEYEYKLDEISGLGLDVQDTTDDTDVNVKVTASSEYEWKVRVAPLTTPSDTWHSRWSDLWTFNTALGASPWAPTLYTPGGVWQYSGLNVELMPAFSWESAKNADSYQFLLADNAEFTSPLVNEKVPESAYQLDFELEYNSNYFWRVMAYDGNKALSRWSDIGAFTTIETAAPAPPAPAPPATVTQPAPAPIVLPTPIPPALLWSIIGIGALLIIAVIVLIIRTRRPI